MFGIMADRQTALNAHVVADQFHLISLGIGHIKRVQCTHASSAIPT